MVDRDGIILYAHGARDVRWSEPFLRLRERVAAKAPQALVELAFLDYMTPDLASAARKLAASGVARIRVVPLFFGRGGHLRDDLPRQLDAARAAVPTIALEVTEGAGENDAVLDALADFALNGAAALQDERGDGKDLT